MIMHNTIIELRRGDFVFDGAVGIRGVVSIQSVTIKLGDLDADTTARGSLIQSMWLNSDQIRLKNIQGMHIVCIVEEG